MLNHKENNNNSTVQYKIYCTVQYSSYMYSTETLYMIIQYSTLKINYIETYVKQIAPKSIVPNAVYYMKNTYLLSGFCKYSYLFLQLILKMLKWVSGILRIAIVMF